LDIPIWKIVMAARQFDLTCDEIERFDQSKFNATAPHVVNSALTCELYLKALYLITTGKIIKGHNLWDLYLEQTPKVKDDIYQEYYVLHQTRPVPAKYKGEMSEKIFAELIEEVKDVFVVWRYIYEVPNESIRLGILTFLRMSLRKVTSKLYDGADF
jgi:HEPN domain-containing protein